MDRRRAKEKEEGERRRCGDEASICCCFFVCKENGLANPKNTTQPRKVPRNSRFTFK
jgi:hypothetical protein